MKICFYYYFPKYKPKGDVLQFLTLLKAFDQKVEELSVDVKKKYVVDCVLPFEFTNGQDGYDFKNVTFHQTEKKQITEKIIELNEKRDYDFIFVRGRKEAIDLIEAKKKFAEKLLVLSIHYDLTDDHIMNEMLFVLHHSRMMFFQSEPWAERFKSYVAKQNFSLHQLTKKIKVLPQFVERTKDDFPMNRASPPHLIQAGVIRQRYGLETALIATKLIRKKYPDVFLHFVYPSIEKTYVDKAKKILEEKEVIDHGVASLWKTKQLILNAGVGLALIFDDTRNKNPTFSYLTRILEYSVLGIPVMTTKTIGNVHLFGEDYPLFVKDEQDILQCYENLLNPHFYQKMSHFVSDIGKNFTPHVAIKQFWNTIHEELEKGKSHS
ncbi:glycosyltransferase family 1 protein [Bacillus sp. FJAT-47783]|uniref:glycosyltransferase family 1 protein n=1 Tax=Bacillus sp. FJAT-47783 TaxID=2922712 RepID=UPI001FAD9FA4|nr:glycosyltransferase family 1 protein [Bacillus sp. FJAT-47783]